MKCSGTLTSVTFENDSLDSHRMMETQESKRPFKVIVIGAGVTGLTLSHALSKDNVDHVVLERGSLALAQGSSIGIHPHGCRILDQLGLLPAVEASCLPMKQFVNRMPDGKELSRSDFFDFIRER